MKQRLRNIVRIGVWLALAMSWFHASPILDRHQAGPSDHRFVYQVNYVSLFAVQLNTTSEQNLPHKTFEADIVRASALADFITKNNPGPEVPRLFSSEILLTLTTSSYL